VPGLPRTRRLDRIIGFDSPSPSPATPAGLAPLQCNGTLWEHTYSKSRFTVYSVCSAETVTVTASNYSNDGDLDADAIDATGKYLAIEIPCQRLPTTSEALTTHVCDGIIPTVVPDVLVPGVYDVAGPNVWDNRHNWREIHGAAVRLRSATALNDVNAIPALPRVRGG